MSQLNSHNFQLNNPINPTNSMNPINPKNPQPNKPDKPVELHGPVIIGTIHLDIRASSRLIHLLKTLRPTCVAVEISRFSVNFRKKHEHRWLKRFHELRAKLPEKKRCHFRIELLKRQLKMPFEWECATKYCSSYNIPCHPIDSGDLSRRELPRWDTELLRLDNLILATEEPDLDLDTYFQGHYQRAKTILLEKKSSYYLVGGLVFDPHWCKRDEIISRRLMDLSKRYYRTVYIGGWMHLVDDGRSFSLGRLGQKLNSKMFLITGDECHKI